MLNDINKINLYDSITIDINDIKLNILNQWYYSDNRGSELYPLPLSRALLLSLRGVVSMSHPHDK